MGLRLEAAIGGDLRKVMAKEWRTVGPVIRDALREAGKGLVADLKKDAQNADLKKLGKTWRSRVFRGRGGPINTVVLIYPKGGARTRGAIQAFEDGATIRAVNAQYLAIPTNFNRKGGRLGGKVLFKPRELQGAFVQKSKNGTLMIMAPVRKAQTRLASGTIRDRAFVESHMLGGGRVRRSAKILKARAVPMFVLKREIKIRKRLNIAGQVRRWRARVPALVLKHWKGRKNAR